MNAMIRGIYSEAFIAGFDLAFLVQQLIKTATEEYSDTH